MIVSLAANSGGLTLPTVHRKLRWRKRTSQGLCTVPFVFDNEIPTLFPTLLPYSQNQNFDFKLKISTSVSKFLLDSQNQNLDFEVKILTLISKWKLFPVILWP